MLFLSIAFISFRTINKNLKFILINFDTRIVKDIAKLKILPHHHRLLIKPIVIQIIRSFYEKSITTYLLE